MPPRRFPNEELVDGRQRIRRTDEHLLRDLQQKIEEIRRRAEMREAKSSPTIRWLLKAVRAIDKAIDAAEADDDTALRHLLSDGREPLAGYLESRGVVVPKGRRPRGRRPKPGAG